MTPAEFATVVLALCPEHSAGLLTAADDYADWAIETYSRPRAAIDEAAGRLGALAEGMKLLAHRELTGTGER